MLALLLKATGTWLVMVIVAIANALLREKLLAPAIGYENALPASGLLLSFLVFMVAFGFVPFFDSSEGKTYIFIGLAWFAFTLSFEILFGHFVTGKPWHAIMQVFNVKKRRPVHFRSAFSTDFSLAVCKTEKPDIKEAHNR
jgi:hypothetical protein